MPHHAGAVSHTAARLLVGIARRTKVGRSRLLVLAAATLLASLVMSAMGMFTKKQELFHA
ncbi:hypothetical protein ACVOMT_24220 (plasmid) [Sphingomonas panni]